MVRYMALSIHYVIFKHANAYIFHSMKNLFNKNYIKESVPILTFSSRINTAYESVKEKTVFIFWYFSLYEQ